MEIGHGVIWQQAAGDTNRNYVDLCLRWDVILNGPGNEGPWPSSQEAYRGRGISARKLTDIKRFAEQMQDGDLVVLRTGTAAVVGVGQVVGEYEWHPEFGDIDGWVLQHVRRVRWLWKGGDNPQTFDTYAMKLGDTTQILGSEAVKNWLAALEVPDDAWSQSPVPLPPDAGNTNETSIGRDI